MKKFLKSIFLLSYVISFMFTYLLPMRTSSLLPVVEGRWVGTFGDETKKSDITMHVYSQNRAGNLDIEIDSEAEGLIEQPVDGIVSEDNVLKFGTEYHDIYYKGLVNEDESEISGTFNIEGKSYFLVFKRTLKREVPDSITEESFESELAKRSISLLDYKPGEAGVERSSFWIGSFDMGVTELNCQLVVSDVDGKIETHLDIPEEELDYIPVNLVVNIKDQSVKFEVDYLDNKNWRVFKCSYEGLIDKEETEISGTINILGLFCPLVFKRWIPKSFNEKPPFELNRPQAPVYQGLKTETVRYKNNKVSGVNLVGEFTIPKGSGPFPAVILVAGSGIWNSEYTGLAHKFFPVLADYLANNGVVVLRLDKRGCGHSTGDFKTATMEDFASDVQAGIEYLKSRPEINNKQIGLIGHSEGATVSSMTAAMSPDVNFLVMLGGPGVNLEEIAYEQRTLIGRALGLTEGYLSVRRKYFSEVYAIVKGETDIRIAEEKISSFYKEFLAKHSDVNQKKHIEGLYEVTKQDISCYPGFRFSLTFDPALVLKQVEIPVLALFGEHDLRVSSRQNLLPVLHALEEAGNTDHTVLELLGLNHNFQHCETGSPREIVKIDETIAPEVLEMISKWILERTGKR